MKNLLIGAAALALLAGSAMAAPSGTHDITITGSVADTCTLAVTAASFSGGASAQTATTLTVANLADATSAVAQAWGAVYNVAGMCNYAHNVSLRSDNGGLVYGGAVTVTGGTFAQRASYTAAIANWDGVLNLTTTGSSASNAALPNTAAHAVTGAFATAGTTLTVSGTVGSDPLLSGAYSDVLRVKVGATF